MPRHIWIYLPIVLLIAAMFAVTAVDELIEFHQFRSLNKAITTEANEVTPGYIQGVVRERRTRRGSSYRYYAYVDYATPEIRSTLKARISEEQYESFYNRKQVRVIYHPENHRIAIMEGAREATRWEKRLLILFLTAGGVICVHLILGWLLAPKKHHQYNFSTRSDT